MPTALSERLAAFLMARATPILARVADIFARQGLMASLGARLVEARDGRCIIEAPWRDSIAQQHGLFHGGALAALADTAGGLAALSAAPPGADVLTAEFKIAFLRPAHGELARAEARVLRAGRSLATVVSRVVVTGQDNEIHCAELLGTMFIRADAGSR